MKVSNNFETLLNDSFGKNADIRLLRKRMDLAKKEHEAALEPLRLRAPSSPASTGALAASPTHAPHQPKSS